MAENKNTGFLKVVLMIFAVISIVYGIGYFFAPGFLVNLSGDTPVFHGWLRWSGGVLIALGIGAILVYLNPLNQGIFVTAMALGSLLIGIALLWAWLTLQEDANPWFTALPTILAFVLAILLWWGRTKAKEILYPKKD
jgi:peptidoglycan/LPS O-acetylase OafA/YrhL